MRFELSTTIGGHARLTGTDLERIAKAGFSTIDVSLPAGAATGGERWLADIQQPAVNAGIEIGGLSAPWSIGPIALAHASVIGTSRVTLIADSCRAHLAASGAPTDADKLARGLETLAREALERNLTLAVEFPRAFRPETIVDLLEGTDAVAPGVCLDVGHANLTGDAAEMIETLAG
ncbi:MAG TPA: hypothetical protein VFV78_13020, partial [Vicinamibacterales bacterium]|nr:hypothetical protein [Vicinamibacterales bacterium]